MTEKVQDTSDWSIPQPEYIPRPTYWPAIFALGVVLILLGVVTHWMFSVVGFLFNVVALSGWIGELCHEQSGEK